MNTKNGQRLNYHTMSVVALIAGAFGIALHFMLDGELLAFMLSVAALGSLMGGNNDYSEPDRQQLRKSYKTAYEWLLLAIMAAYALIVISSWFNFLGGMVIFMNSHWPSLVLSIMCLFMGMAGLQRIRGASST